MRRSARMAALALAASLILSGCAGAPSPGEDLRTLVVSAAESAAAGDIAAASAAIDELEARVVSARTASGLSPEEADEILATIAVVRADLATLANPPAPEPQSPAAPVQEPTVVLPEDGGAGNGGGEEGAGPGNGDEGNRGEGNGDEGNPGKGPDKDKGEGKGKGNGEGKGKGKDG